MDVVIKLQSSIAYFLALLLFDAQYNSIHRKNGFLNTCVQDSSEFDVSWNIGMYVC